MRLKTFRIRGCFGFLDSGDVDLDPPGGITYLLGRNSSGKTSFLQALRHLEENQDPSSYKNFLNFNPPQNESPFLTACFAVEASDFKGYSSRRWAAQIRKAGVPPELLDKDAQIQDLLTIISKEYSELIESLLASGHVWVHKSAEGSYFFHDSKDKESYKGRKDRITRKMAGVFPNGKLRREKEYTVDLSAQQIENNFFNHFPAIIFFGDSYQLNEDLSDRITKESLRNLAEDSLEADFVSFLGREEVERFLRANDPDERDSILKSLRARTKILCDRINKGSPSMQKATSLIDIVLHENNGLQVTIKADDKKSFYRHLSPNTKILIAYQLHMLSQNIEGNILLFDEPSTGFHPTAQAFLLEFLQSLAQRGNQVVVSSHSEYMIDLNALAGVRLMKPGKNGTLSIANHPYRRARSGSDMLALQPILDAIGLQYGMGLTLGRNIILTEGVSDLLYLRAFSRIRGNSDDLSIAPARGDSSLYTLLAFLISQGAGIKLVIDAGGLRANIQAAYGMPDEAIFEVSIPQAFRPDSRTSGIEDLFSKRDFYEMAIQLGVDVGNREGFFRVPNSHVMRKHSAKRILAHEFLASLNSRSWEFDDETQSNVSQVLDFCTNPVWFTL